MIGSTRPTVDSRTGHCRRDVGRVSVRGGQCRRIFVVQNRLACSPAVSKRYQVYAWGSTKWVRLHRATRKTTRTPHRTGQLERWGLAGGVQRIERAHGDQGRVALRRRFMWTAVAERRFLSELRRRGCTSRAIVGQRSLYRGSANCVNSRGSTRTSQARWIRSVA